MDVSDSNMRWDAVVIGGALSGAATAQLLLKRNPRLKVLILERDHQFTRRVGESTVEVSAFFLGRVLGLTEHLNQEHLVKQGLRFWFQNGETQSLDQCSETGPGYNVRFPGYQVDRAVLDEKVLANAAAAGAVIRRGVKVTDVELVSGGTQTVHWQSDTGERGTLATRWVVDASGVAALLARKNGWFTPNREHPIASIWSRWSKVKNWDDAELAAKFPKWSRRTKAVRFTATNHLTGYGWWAWWIPLKGGDVSIGVVFDQRITDLPEGPNLGERLRTMLLQHPAARELLADAAWQPGDVHFRRNLAYRSTTFAGEGFVLVGDAAAFMDPFYSPGMDWISYSTSAAAALIDDCCRGKPAAMRVARHNERFEQSYARWFAGVYRNKYFYMADFELMTLAFRLDLGLYYLGVVYQPFKHGAKALEVPSFASREAKIPAKIMAFYNRRLVKIALARRERGAWGRRNAGQYFPFRSYELTYMLPLRVVRALFDWIWLEFREGWRSWFRRIEPTLELPPRRSQAGETHRSETRPAVQVATR
jgi:flavin-dependent dehydrogenase